MQSKIRVLLLGTNASVLSVFRRHRQEYLIRHLEGDDTSLSIGGEPQPHLVVLGRDVFAPDHGVNEGEEKGTMWGAKNKGATGLSHSALGAGAIGNIVVVICGDRLDSTLVSLGSYMAKGAKRKVSLLHVIEVPRAFPLKAVLTRESERADKLLNAAMEIAEKVGCDAEALVVQARDAGPAIVDEAKDHGSALILIGHLRQNNVPQNELGKTVAYVLANAPCRVWLVQDRQERLATNS